jgi:hypothetical protein
MPRHIASVPQFFQPPCVDARNHVDVSLHLNVGSPITVLLFGVQGRNRTFTILSGKPSFNGLVFIVRTFCIFKCLLDVASEINDGTTMTFDVCSMTAL